MNKASKIFMALALVAGFTAPAWALRLAYVDVAEVFDQYEGTVTAKAELKKEADKKRKELEVQQNDLSKQIDDLKAQKSVLPAAKYKDKEDKLKGQVQILQEQIQTVQEELAGKEKKKTKAILEEIRGIVRELAQEEKYDFILEKNALVFGGDDVTFKVLKRLNKK
jgi:outer membrane protein